MTSEREIRFFEKSLAGSEERLGCATNATFRMGTIDSLICVFLVSGFMSQDQASEQCV